MCCVYINNNIIMYEGWLKDPVHFTNGTLPSVLPVKGKGPPKSRLFNEYVVQFTINIFKYVLYINRIMTSCL